MLNSELARNYRAGISINCAGKVKLINDPQKYLQAGARSEQFVSVDKTIRLAWPACLPACLLLLRFLTLFHCDDRERDISQSSHNNKV